MYTIGSHLFRSLALSLSFPRQAERTLAPAGGEAERSRATTPRAGRAGPAGRGGGDRLGQRRGGRGKGGEGEGQLRRKKRPSPSLCPAPAGDRPGRPCCCCCFRVVGPGGPCRARPPFQEGPHLATFNLLQRGKYKY